MTWKTPETEEAWEECLSAYVDGEMSSDDRTELENILKSDPKRATQLEDLKKTSSLLREWKIDAPLPDAAFISEVRNQAGQKRNSTLASWFRSFKVQHALPSFIIGVLVGILIVNQNVEPAVESETKPEQKVSEYSISSSQTDELLEEVDAQALKGKILNELKHRNIATAFETYKELEAKYPESQALKSLNENRRLLYLLT